LDAMAQAQAQDAGQAKLRAHGRSKIIDTLWIMVPLLLLAAAVTWVWTRSATRDQEQKTFQEYHEKAVKKELKKQFADFQEVVRWPLYSGRVAQAQVALEGGNLDLARQKLMHAPQTLRGKAPEKEHDLRRFDW